MIPLDRPVSFIFCVCSPEQNKHLVSPRVSCTRAAAPFRDGQKQRAEESESLYPVHSSSGLQAGDSARYASGSTCLPRRRRRFSDGPPLTVRASSSCDRKRAANPLAGLRAATDKSRLPQGTENIGLLHKPVELASHFSVLGSAAGSVAMAWM